MCRLPGTCSPPLGSSRGQRLMSTTAYMSIEIIEFLNALPTSLNMEDWIVAFRNALQQLLDDVDRVLVVPNTACDLIDPGSYRPNMWVSQRIGEREVSDASDMLSSSMPEEDRPSTQLLKDFERLNYPLHLYHPPTAYEYYYKGTAYLGAIFLFREKEQRAISSDTLELMDALRPFFIFALSDAITRHHYAKPVDRAYFDALQRMSQDARLTAQDQRIIVHLLLGYSYKETADLLGIKLDTVKKHIKRVHQRTGARSQGELFAMYFTARFGLKVSGDGEED